MSTVLPLCPRPGETPGPLPLDARLPGSLRQLEAGAAGIYHAALQGSSREELLRLVCVHLARALSVPLVMLARKGDNGMFAIEGTSREGALWLEFHRVGECWEGSATGNGPASAALRAGRPVQMSFDADGLRLWRRAAGEDRIGSVTAWPLRVGEHTYVLEVFDGIGVPAAPGGSTVTIEILHETLAKLLTDLHTIETQQLLSRALEQAGNASFITDAHGTIRWSNRAFTDLSGYAAEEVRGKNPSVLRSGRQGVRYYRDLWSTIRSGKVWTGDTVDRDKDGGLYTIRQTVSPITRDGRITHYVSIHEDRTEQQRKQRELELVARLDEATGLLTPAAFEAAAAEALSTVAARANGADLLLISLRGLRRASASLTGEATDFLASTMGRRVREAVPAPHLAALAAPFEYAVLIQRDQLGGRTVEELIAASRRRLAEPVLYLGQSVDVDVHVAHARHPEDGGTFEELLSAADRQLADEPVARRRPIHT